MPAQQASAARPAQVIDLPGWRPIVRKVFTTLALVSALPMAVFYTAMSIYGLRAAALATVSLYYGALLVKILRRQPILAAALLTAGLLSIRTVVMFLTGSAFIYFLQPVAGTVALATVIAASALAGRPILNRPSPPPTSTPASAPTTYATPTPPGCSPAAPTSKPSKSASATDGSPPPSNTCTPSAARTTMH